jgi:hypothetical protein
MRHCAGGQTHNVLVDGAAQSPRAYRRSTVALTHVLLFFHLLGAMLLAILALMVRQAG